jgi:outer membrane protein OmpA-like peptidoglycan-associated protein
MMPRLCLPGLFALAISVSPASPVLAETTDTAAEIVDQLKGLEAAPEIDTAAWRQLAAERIKSRAYLAALKRPPVAAQLLRLPHVNADIQFNPDTPVIRPESYRLLGRIADALYDPALMSSAFLIVGRTDANGKRDYNLTLSQRRAEAIRDALVATFKVSPKRLLAVGLGEEELADADHPKAAVNQQALIVTVR